MDLFALVAAGVLAVGLAVLWSYVVYRHDYTRTDRTLTWVAVVASVASAGMLLLFAPLAHSVTVAAVATLAAVLLWLVRSPAPVETP